MTHFVIINPPHFISRPSDKQRHPLPWGSVGTAQQEKARVCREISSQ